MKPKRKSRKTAKQRRAGEFLDLHSMIHFLITEQRCPIIWDGKLAYVRCPGVSKEAFKQAREKRVMRNLLAYIDQHVPSKVINHGGPAP